MSRADDLISTTTLVEEFIQYKEPTKAPTLKEFVDWLIIEVEKEQVKQYDPRR